MNNFRHRATSIRLFLTSENPRDFSLSWKTPLITIYPGTDEDANLVTDSVRARWMVRRRHRASEQTEFELYERNPTPPTLQQPTSTT